MTTVSGSRQTLVLLTEPKDASHGDETVKPMAHCVQGLLLQDEVSGKSQTRYTQHLHSHLHCPDTKTMPAAAVDCCLCFTVVLYKLLHVCVHAKLLLVPNSSDLQSLMLKGEHSTSWKSREFVSSRLTTL